MLMSGVYGKAKTTQRRQGAGTQTGDFRVARAESTEHGFSVDFDKGELRSFIVLMETPAEDRDEVAARKSEPLHRPIIGTVSNETYLQIFFSDVIRQVDQNSNVDVGELHISAEKAAAVVAPDALHVQNTLAVRVAEIFSDGLSQRDPRSQFLVLWSAIELLTNSVASHRLLSDDDISATVAALQPYDRASGFGPRLLRSLLPDGMLTRIFRLRGTPAACRDHETSLNRPALNVSEVSRIEGALRQVDTLTYREKVRAALTETFGECKHEADRAIAGLRKLRGPLVHPRSPGDPEPGELIAGLTELRQMLRRHLDLLSRTRDASHHAPA